MKRLVSSLALAALAFAGGAFSAQFAHAGPGDPSPFGMLAQLARVLVLVEKAYVDPVDRERLVEGAIKGMVAELDPHSTYFPPPENALFRDETEGKFSGVGLEVEVRDGLPFVVVAIEGSPAAKAGVKAGERIVAIDGEPTRGQSLDRLIRKMRGEAGTRVEISVQSENDEAARRVLLVRDNIRLNSVVGKRLSHDIGYVRIKQFQRETHTQFLETLGQIRASAPRPLAGLLLDLRNNPGGLVDEAQAIADELLDGGLVFTTRQRGQIIDEARARGGGAFAEGPLVVLVNEYSASASELLAGALQDHRRAKLVGATTFGKGSVQSILDLPGGAGLKLTTMRYYTPSGRGIQALGIAPDVPAGPPGARAVVRERDLENHLPAESSPGHPLPEGARGGGPAEGARGGPGGEGPDAAGRGEPPDDPEKGNDRALAAAYRLLRQGGR
ncbi:MAG TPA: S41 family peptidase [Polyangiaceae bacterium]|nr:S41 family peptidase [Polyangiaceae bacterium]